jgi:hypothetical protein
MGLGFIIFLIILVVGFIIFIMYLVSKSKGKIEIQLDKFNFTPGEVINGNVILNLKKTFNAKAMEVGLIGVSKSSQYRRNSSGGIKHSSSTQNIFEFYYPVDGEKDYNPGQVQYKFQIKIPENIFTNLSTGNRAIDSLVKSAMFVTGTNRNVKWYVTGRLKIGGFDIKKRVQVNIA